MRGNRLANCGYILLPVVLAITLLAAIGFLLNRESALGTNMNTLGGQQDIARYVANAGLQHGLQRLRSANCASVNDMASTVFEGHTYQVSYTPRLLPNGPLNMNSPVIVSSLGTLSNAGLAAGATATQTLFKQTVSPAYAQRTDTLDAAADTYIDSANQNSNLGDEDRLRVRGDATRRNTLLRYDLSPLIAMNGFSLKSATLTLYQEFPSGAGNISVHKITQAWREGDKRLGDTNGGSTCGVSWKLTECSFYSGAPWTNPGGDYDPASVAITYVDATKGSVSWDITLLMNDWLTNGGNNGLLLAGDDPSVNAGFLTRKDSATKRPRLQLVYTTTCASGVPPKPLP